MSPTATTSRMAQIQGFTSAASLDVSGAGLAGRSESVSGSDSSSDSGSNSPASPLQTPITGTLPRIAPISPSTSPILSYFLSQSPKSPNTSTFPFRRGFGTAVFEGELSFLS